MVFVYIHTRLDTNEVFYVGIAKKPSRPYDRINRNPFWKRIVSKTDYNVEIVHQFKTWEDACKKEKELIMEYGRRDLGTGTLVNLTNGGDGILGGKSWKYKQGHTKETREKMSKIQSQNAINRIGNPGKPHTKETREKLAEMRKGKSLSKETREKISKKLTNRVFSDVTLSRMSAAHKGKIVSDETRLRMSDAKKGKKFSESHIINIRDSRNKLKKSVVQLDDCGNVLKEYDSVTTASYELNCSRSTIKRWIKNNKGFSFK